MARFVKYDNGKFITGSGGGGSGATLEELDDVNISTPTDGQALKYNATSQKWENKDDEAYPFSVVDGKVCITYTT